jgi:hypothetical protein
MDYTTPFVQILQSLCYSQYDLKRCRPVQLSHMLLICITIPVYINQNTFINIVFKTTNCSRYIHYHLKDAVGTGENHQVYFRSVYHVI